jgi:hypothetical protein
LLSLRMAASATLAATPQAILVPVATVIGVGERVRGPYRLENPRSDRASLQRVWLQGAGPPSGVNGSGR